MTKVTAAWVRASLELADNERSKITEREKELYGLSSIRLKSFINNVCAKEDINYLEIGVYKGSTLISAAYGNPKTKVVGVENFKYDDREPQKHAPNNSIWENMKSQLYSNIDRYKDPDSGVRVSNISIIESDFRDIDWSTLPKFDVCFFDVTPVNAAIYDAFFEKVTESLLSESVVIFSNYSNELHAKELDAALARHENRVSIQWKEQRISGGLSDATKYYSGMCVIGLKKKAIVKSAPKNE
jgi:hypothetical protein